jgi:histidine ammonia-lyase
MVTSSQTVNLTIDPGYFDLDQLQVIHSGGIKLILAEHSRAKIRQSQKVVQVAADGDAPVYGVNTGFGKLANQRIDKEKLATLQLNLIRSHSVGVGEPLSPEVTRLMMALKAASLARGYSGVSEVVIDTLIAVHNAGLVPYIPAQGSVGASGDLAPLAHMTLALIGEGEMLVDGKRVPALPALEAASFRPKRRFGVNQRHTNFDRISVARAFYLQTGIGSRASDRRPHH